METGYVRKFKPENGKQFGFLEIGGQPDLFFHISGGCTVALDANEDITFKPGVPRFPREGDPLKFKRGKNAKGPMASAWCFESQYNELVEKRKRDLTIDRAKGILQSAAAKVLQYTETNRAWGGITTVERASVTWSDGTQTIAKGKFVRFFSRYESEDESKNVLRETTSQVTVISPDNTRHRDTQFQGPEAEALKDLGRERKVEKGVYVHVGWNGGSDFFVVDPATVRDMTEAELKETSPSSPWLGHHEWLKCTFAREHGGEAQVVRILAHLGSHD